MTDTSKTAQKSQLPNLTDEIVLIIEYHVPDHNRHEFIARMQKSCQETIRDKGCLRMEFVEPLDEPGVYFLTERWTHDKYIHVHRQKPGHDEQHQITDSLCTFKRVTKALAYRTHQPLSDSG